MLTIGQRVVLVNTGNDRIPDGTPAVVQRVEPWGAHVKTAATQTGRYRAGWAEMADAPATGYVCEGCGGSNVTRSGSCLLCQDCGQTSGCS